jgi:putative ABC transport system ATP-binding protein
MNTSFAESTNRGAADASSAVAPVPAARLVGAVKTYGAGPGAVRALDGVDVAFDTGAFTAVMGPSGSGKSTLLHCGVGLDRLTEGRALIGDTELGALRDRDLTLLRRARVGFVFQAFNLIPSLSARENITLPLDLAGRAPDQGFFDELVGTLGISSRLAYRPSELSGGQQQRVAIARALLGRPDIVFADEPTGNLDSRSGAEVLAFLRYAARERGQSIVMVTHDPVAASYADRAVFLSDGHLVGDLAAPTRESVLAELRRVAS